MPTNFANLNISKIILHRVYERDENRQIVSPTISAKCTKLDGDGLQTLKTRIIEAVGHASHSIEMNISDTEAQSCFGVVKSMIQCRNSVEQFITLSQKLPGKLAFAQTSRKIPGGVVVIINGTIGASSKPCVVVIKAESHEGFVSDETDNVISLSYLQSLLLTPHQKFYKIGMFIWSGDGEDDDMSPDGFDVFVYDHNLTVSDTNSAAVYFYNTFLGLTIPETAKHLTKSYFEYSRMFINDLVVDDERKLDLQTSLYTYLKSDQSPVISVNDFATRYLEPAQRDGYISFMHELGFPQNAVSKDLELLHNVLKLRKIKFSSAVKVTAPADRFDELVNVVETSPEGTTLRISGKIMEQK